MVTPKKSRAAPKRKSASPAKRTVVAKKPKPAEPRGVSTAAKGAAVRAGVKDPRAAATKGKGAKRPAAPPPPVRPLGVLPPESRARAIERPAPPPMAPVKPSATRKSASRSEPAGVQGVTEKDFPFFEDLLLKELVKIRKEMGHLESTVLKVNPRDSSGDLSGYSFHMADAGTDAMEREKAFLFASVEGRKELEIREALQRIYDGTYGVCETCGRPIARLRLEAVPYVRLCVSCKQKEEQQASRSQPG